MSDDNGLGDLFGPLLGREVPGGCDECASFQTITEDENLAGVWHLVVLHDKRCPFLRTRNAPAN